MRHVIVGTAGHIDHGKTSLVRALTGIDTDRLKEEKQRGITIDIGFAYLDLGDVKLGFVDVPGHERFVKNMLAGAHGIDMVLLVVAADESVMPQTREHADICRLLGVSHGIVVMTKTDLVDAELLELATAEVEDFVRGSFLEGAPVLHVSSQTGIGIPDLKAALGAMARLVPARNIERPFRLPIDRAFTIRGFGTVVTGTSIAGSVHVGDALEILPGGQRVKVRGLQAHNTTVQVAGAGQRTAVNLQGLELGEVRRGQVLSPAGRFSPTSMIDVRLRVLESAARPLQHRARVRLHHGTSETMARVVLLGVEQIEPGGDALAQIRLESPIVALPDDRFILRSYSPSVTIAGGVVIDALPPRHRASDRRTAGFLEALESAPAIERVRLFIGHAGPRGSSLAEIAARSGLTDAEINEHAAAHVRAGELVQVAEQPPRWLARAAVDDLQRATVAFLEAFHQRDPLAPGLPMEELRSAVFGNLAVKVFRSITAAMIESGRLVRDRDVFVLAGRAGGLSPADRRAREQLENAIRAAGLEAPTLAEAAARAGLTEAKARKYYDLMLRDGLLVRLGDLLFHRDALEELKEELRRRAAVNRVLDIGGFRELSGGLSRKYTIPILEWLDRERVTRRVGDRREILVN